MAQWGANIWSSESLAKVKGFHRPKKGKRKRETHEQGNEAHEHSGKYTGVPEASLPRDLQHYPHDQADEDEEEEDEDREADDCLLEHGGAVLFALQSLDAGEDLLRI